VLRYTSIVSQYIHYWFYHTVFTVRYKPKERKLSDWLLRFTLLWKRISVHEGSTSSATDSWLVQADCWWRQWRTKYLHTIFEWSNYRILRPWIFFCGFVTNNVNVPPLPMASEELKTRITETRTKTDHDVLEKVWQEVEYWFGVVCVIRGPHSELYYFSVHLYGLVLQMISISRLYVKCAFSNIKLMS